MPQISQENIHRFRIFKSEGENYLYALGNPESNGRITCRDKSLIRMLQLKSLRHVHHIT